MAKFTQRQQQVMELLGEDATSLFARHGIEVQGPNGKGFLNLSTCPWCNHGPENFQCGVAQTRGARGHLHAFKCFHPHDGPTGEDAPHYADVLAEIGEITADEAAWSKSIKSFAPAAPVQAKKAAGELRRLNTEFNDRGRKRLRESPAVVAYLRDTRGYSDKTIERFRLGLGEYADTASRKTIYSGALTAPLLGPDGQFYSKYVNYTIPGITVDNRDKPQRAWSAGEARTYYSGSRQNKTRLFVCDGLKDVWALYQALEGTTLGKEMLIISSTNGGAGHPAEWKNPEFWEGWEAVYLGHDNDKPDPHTGRKAGDMHAVSVAKLAHREMLRVCPPLVKDWNDFFVAGRTARDFEQLLVVGEPVDLRIIEKAAESDGLGRHEAMAVSIAGAYHQGHLFEIALTLVRDVDEAAGSTVERYETVVVRSDRTMHRPRRMPAPKGTPENLMTWRLQPDGTLLDGPPKHNPFSTWQWPSIQAYLDKTSKPRDIGDMLEQVRQHLKASIWLPFEDDYTMLACTAVVTYTQAVFDAVPLLLVTGAAGSGKTQLGIAMSEICANSPGPVGQISPASIARLIDQARGFIVLDDLESVGRKNSDGQFDELIQTLKLSYNKQSATKYWTNMKSGKLEKLNFFGVKLINNTRGVDAILGSRMLKVLTKKLPDGQQVISGGRLSPDQVVQLRNDLHTWAFTHTKQVYQTYATIYPNRTGRADEISAPLRVISAMTGNVTVAESLERALKRQEKMDITPESPEQVMREALERIIRRAMVDQGVVQTVVSVTQLMMEMALLVDNGYGKSFTTELSDIESPEWVGRQLRQNYTDPTGDQVRTQMYGKFLRSYPLAMDFVNKIVARTKEELSSQGKGIQMSADPRMFCAGCPACPYQNRCDMQAVRSAKERPIHVASGPVIPVAAERPSVAH
jgi:hypothetical protein